jgi:hypothetical protein
MSPSIDILETLKRKYPYFEDWEDIWGCKASIHVPHSTTTSQIGKRQVTNEESNDDQVIDLSQFSQENDDSRESFQDFRRSPSPPPIVITPESSPEQREKNRETEPESQTALQQGKPTVSEPRNLNLKKARKHADEKLKNLGGKTASSVLQDSIDFRERNNAQKMKLQREQLDLEREKMEIQAKTEKDRMEFQTKLEQQRLDFEREKYYDSVNKENKRMEMEERIKMKELELKHDQIRLDLKRFESA